MSKQMVVPEPTDEDLTRINALLRKVGGPSVLWGSKDRLDVWTVEQRARQDAILSRRLLVASWALVVVTVGLVVATVALIVVA